MAVVTYKVLYWQEIPVQVNAEGEDDEVSIAFDPKFMERVDFLAAQRGLQGADEYLAQWQWSDEEKREGKSAKVVAELVKSELEAQVMW